MNMLSNEQPPSEFKESEMNKLRKNGKLRLMTLPEVLEMSLQDKPHLEKLYRWAGLLEEESDRGMVVLAATVFEETLGRLLQTFLVEGKHTKNLLRHDGALGSFGVRTQLCHALGLLSENEAHDLEEIATIRNKFAHNFEMEFVSDTIHVRCLRLKCSPAPGDQRVAAKMHFGGACLYLMYALCEGEQDLRRSRRKVPGERALWVDDGPDSRRVVLKGADEDSS